MSGGRYESRGEVAAPNLIVSSTRVKDAPFGIVRVDKVPDDVLESWEMRSGIRGVRWQRRRAGNERSAPITISRRPRSKPVRFPRLRMSQEACQLHFNKQPSQPQVLHLIQQRISIFKSTVILASTSLLELPLIRTALTYRNRCSRCPKSGEGSNPHDIQLLCAAQPAPCT